MYYDAIIVGAGPAGAATALMLAQAGWSVAIIEKQIFPRTKVCGEFISATSHTLLETFGLSHIYSQIGGPEIRRVGVLAGNSKIYSAMPKIKDHLRQYGRALGRMHLDTELLKCTELAGATVFQPCLVRGLNLEKSLHKVEVCKTHLASSFQLTTRILILANGSWEKPLQNKFIYKKSPLDFLAFKASFTNTNLDKDKMPMLAFPGGYGGIINTTDNELSLSCCIRRKELDVLRKNFPEYRAGDAVLKHIKDNTLGVQEILAGATLNAKWLSTGPIRPGIRSCFENGIFYVGNIAGEAHPVIAEGISMALQSGWILAQELITAKAYKRNTNLIAVGEKYQQSWRKHFKSRIQAAALFTHLAINPKIVSIALPILKFFPGILTMGARWSGKSKLLFKN